MHSLHNSHSTAIRARNPAIPLAPEFSLPPLHHHLQQRASPRRTTVACPSASADRPSTVGWRLVRGIPAAGPSDPVLAVPPTLRQSPCFSSCARGCSSSSPFHPVTALPYPTSNAQEPSCSFVAPLHLIVSLLLFYALAFYYLRPATLLSSSRLLPCYLTSHYPTTWNSREIPSILPLLPFTTVAIISAWIPFGHEHSRRKNHPGSISTQTQPDS